MKTFTYTYIHGNADGSTRETCEGFITADSIQEAKARLTRRYEYSFTGELKTDTAILNAKEEPTDVEPRIYLFIQEGKTKPPKKRKKRRKR